MWKYIVTYCVLNWISIECPQNIGKEIKLAIDCRESIGLLPPMNKLFYNRDSAIVFYNEIKSLQGIEYDSIKIDSCYIPLEIDK